MMRTLCFVWMQAPGINLDSRLPFVSFYLQDLLLQIKEIKVIRLVKLVYM